MYLLLLVCRGYIDGSVDWQSLAHARRFIAFSARIVGFKDPNRAAVMKQEADFLVVGILGSVYRLQIDVSAVGWIQNGHDACLRARIGVA